MPAPIGDRLPSLHLDLGRVGSSGLRIAFKESIRSAVSFEHATGLMYSA